LLSHWESIKCKIALFFEALLSDISELSTITLILAFTYTHISSTIYEVRAMQMVTYKLGKLYYGRLQIKGQVFHTSGDTRDMVIALAFNKAHRAGLLEGGIIKTNEK
jgi:hypothetical protein